MNWNIYIDFPRVKWNLVLTSSLKLFQIFTKMYNFTLSPSLMWKQCFPCSPMLCAILWYVFLFPVPKFLALIFVRKAEYFLTIRRAALGQPFSNCLFLGALYMLKNYWAPQITFLKNLFIFVYLWLCWVFVSVRGLSLVVASGGHSSSRCAGLSVSRPLLLRSTGSRRAGSATAAHGPSRSAACGIFPDQGSNPCSLHWHAGSQPLRHQGSPRNHFWW